MSAPAPSVTVRAPAKVNLILGVGPVRDDGYHPLETVYHAIGMYDDVTVTAADDWRLTVNTHERIDVSEVPLDERNIAFQAARALIRHHGVDEPAAIHIEKGIPVAGGLAGGSADGAATLLALDRLWGLDTPDDELLALAATLGSDVPFALVGGTAAGGGRGELVHPLPDQGTRWWVVVENDRGMSTPAVYAEFDRTVHGAGAMYDRLSGQAEPRPVAEVLASGDPALLAETLGNDLEEPALSLRPDLRRTLQDGRDAGALAGIVSGSGPTCVFLCSDTLHATAVRIGMLDRGHTRVTAVVGPVPGAHRVSYA